MGFFNQSGETESLLKKKKIITEKWSKKVLKWILFVILFSVLLLFAIYLVHIIILNTVQSESSETIRNKNALHLSSIATTNDDFFKKCAPQIKCNSNAKYRSITGACNNLEKPAWGTSKSPFFRFLNANFSDGYYEVRKQTNGSALPCPRLVNIQMFLSREVYKVDENNVLLLPFGQLIAHDISGLPNDVPRANDTITVIDCCTNDLVRKTYPQCQVVIENSVDDPVYGKHNIHCMGITRSLTSRNYSCPLYPTTFININTHFIDASEVYGSTENISNHLRMMVGGRLHFSIGDNGQMFCPFQNNKVQPFQYSDLKIQYDTGDPDNGNQNLGITAMQTLFLRFHNYIAFKLCAINPTWSDEILYQESRRIVIAVIQHIAYKEYLPVVIGEDFQELYGINKENIYDPAINPAISQELSSAAIRVLHTMIPVQFNFMNRDYEIESSVNVTDWMKKPDLLPISDNFDKLLKGFLETSGRVAQPSYNFFVSNYLFSFPYSPKYTGIDLLSIDITRGRDVGLQPYNQVRHLCGLPLAKDFKDLTDLIHIKDLDKLMEFYHSVDDIDLMVGLLLEKKSDGSLVGPTARCLIADGFYRFKAGDRFFYDVKGQPGSFTPDQLKSIKQITLGHVICAVSNVDHVQKDIFKSIDHNLFPTHKLPCDDEFKIDFKYWEDSNDRSEL